ncbi:MAG: acyltransferase family protein [Anaerolineae bacterium]|nr:acyltransferase family protein [Anaerolineae bacterium]
MKAMNNVIALDPPVAAPDAPISAAPAVARTKASAAERLLYIEPIRVYAMSLVVFIHVAAILAPHYNTISLTDWWTSNFYHALSKGGPPIFTIVSGALLLGISKDQPLGVFFKKRFLKVLIPFLGWAAVYLAWRVVFRGEQLAPEDMIRLLLGGVVYDHLWFIKMILGLYLATPVLRVYVQNATRANLRYFLIVWFVAWTLLPTISRLLNMQINLDLVVMTNYVGYFIGGYYLRDVFLKPKQILPTLLIVVGALLFTQYSTYALTMAKDGQLDDFFLNNQGFNMVIVSAGMFLFLKSLPWADIYARFPRFQKVVLYLASCSLGVYFVHMLIMELLGSGKLGFVIDSYTLGTLIGIPLTAVLTFVLSVGVVTVIKRIPGLKLFVP